MDRQRLEKAKSTIEQAIQAATRHTPGTPVSAELDSHWGQTSYQVEVLQANGTLMEVKIDAVGGEVIRAQEGLSLDPNPAARFSMGRAFFRPFFASLPPCPQAIRACRTLQANATDTPSSANRFAALSR